MKKKNSDIFKLIGYVIFFLFILLVIFLSLKTISTSVINKQFHVLILEIPILYSLFQLALEVLGKINPKTKTKIKLHLKGLREDASVFIVARFKPDDSFDLTQFTDSVYNEMSKKENFNIKKYSNQYVNNIKFEMEVSDTKFDFEVIYEENNVEIKFSRINSIQYNVASYVEKVNKVINEIEFHAHKKVYVTTQIIYEKGNPILESLLDNESDKVSIIYQDKNYTLDKDALEVNSGSGNQVDLVKQALTGDLIDN